MIKRTAFAVALAVSAVMTVMPAAAEAEAAGYFENAGYSFQENLLEGLGMRPGSNSGFSISRALSGPTRITTDASATVYKSPDMASVRFTVTEEATEAGEAMRICSERAEKLIGALKEKVTDEDDVSSGSVSVYPKYEYTEMGEDRITGYIAQISADVSNQDSGDIGEIISEAMENGANEVGELRFFCSDYDEKYEEALKEAVERASEKADIIAEASDMEVTRMVSCTEGYRDEAYRYSVSSAMDMENSAAKAFGASYTVPVSPEDAEITANVSAIFEAE